MSGLFVSLHNGTYGDSKEIAEGIVVEYDQKGRIIAVEFDHVESIDTEFARETLSPLIGEDDVATVLDALAASRIANGE